MFSKKRIRLAVFVFAAVTLGGLYAYVAPASVVERAPIDVLPGIENGPVLRPWGEDLSARAVDAAGVERDLDGNASALYASDQWCGRPACGNPLMP